MNQVFLQPLLAADVREIFGAIVLILVGIRWVFNLIKDTKKQVARQRQQQPQGQRPPQPRPQAVPQPAAAEGGQQADPLRDQVEAFLRRASEQQDRAPQRPVQRPPQTMPANRIEILVGDEPPRQNPPTIKLTKLSTSRPANVQQLAPSRPPLTTVAQHVAEHVAASTKAIGDQASQLGQRIVRDDTQFDEQLKAKFDHSVGTLAASMPNSYTQSTGQAPQETLAGQLAAMLASPGGVRQAVILNEILQRPVDRW